MTEEQLKTETPEVVQEPAPQDAVDVVDGDDAEVQSYDFADEMEDDDSPAADAAPAVEKPVEETAPETTAAETPAESAPEAAPASEEPPQVVTPVERQEQQPVVPPDTPEAAPAALDWNERRQHWVTELQKEYMPSAEEFEKIITDPAEFAAAGARLHMKVLESAVTAVRDVLPVYIDAQIRQRTESTSAEDAFFKKWPELRGQEELIKTYTQSWNKQHPKATLEQRIEGVGKLVMFVTGKTAPAAAAPTPPPPTPPAPPHVGISATGGGVAIPGVVDVDEKMWAQVDQELFQDE